jgi:5-formyltetrahydrofolate cyclo-ligase
VIFITTIAVLTGAPHYNESMSPKVLLREQLQVRRSHIPDATRNIFSEVIADRIIKMVDWHGIRRIHCYIPIVSRAEVDTWPLLRYLWRQWPAIEVAVPGPLRAGHPASLTIDANTKWREAGIIPYPLESLLNEHETFDLIIVPCLGFDGNRYRLGYGSGYYDRFLHVHPTAMSLGVSFWAGYVPDGLPHERHDVALQCIITEESIV